MAKADSSEMAIFPIAIISAMIMLFNQHDPGRLAAGAFDTLAERGLEVGEELIARQQRQRHLQHAHRIVAGGDEGNPDRQRDDGHAEDQDQVRKEGHPGPVLDHQ